MSEQNKVILDTSQAKAALTELEALLHKVDKAMDGITAEGLVKAYGSLGTTAKTLRSEFDKVAASTGTSATSQKLYAAQLDSLRAKAALATRQLNDLKSAIASHGQAAREAEKASASYRITVDGASVSMREQSYLTKEQVKDQAKRIAAEKVALAANKASAAEQADMLKGMMTAKASYQRLGQVQSLAEQMNRARDLAAQKKAAAEQADMMKGMENARASYYAMVQRRDVELNNIRNSEAIKYRQIIERRDLEEYRLRQFHLKRMEALERKWLESSDRARATQALKARRLMDGGIDPSKFYAPQAIKVARGFDSAPSMEKNMKSVAVAAKSAADSTHELGVANDFLHSAARGVTGVLGGLWLTYARMLPVLIATAGATAAVARSFSQGIEFDYQTRFAASLSDSAESVDKLQESLKSGLIEASKSAYGSAVELASGLRIMQQAGYDASLALSAIGTVSQAALVGEVDMKTAAEDLVSVMEIFGLHSENPLILAKNFKHAADVMATVAKNTKANLHDVASSFQNVIGVSEAYGVKIETVAYLTEKLGKAGITAGRAGTFIRNFFENTLGASTDKARKTLEGIGMPMFDVSKDNYIDYIETLKKKIQEYDAVSQSVIENAIFNDRGIKPWRAIRDELTTLIDGTKKYETTVEDSLSNISDNVRKSIKVEFKEAFDALDDSLTVAFDKAEGGTSDLAKKLREVFSSPDLIAAIRGITDALANMAVKGLEGFQKMVEKVDLFISALDRLANKVPTVATTLTNLSNFSLPPHILALMRIYEKGTDAIQGMFPKASEPLPPGQREASGFVRTPDKLTGGFKPMMSAAPRESLISEALTMVPRVTGSKAYAPPKSGRAGGRVDRTPLFEARDVRKEAEAEYEQAKVSIEFYKKGLDLRRDAHMIGEDEYNKTLDSLADLEIQKGIDRERRVQQEIANSLKTVKDDSVRKSLESMNRESLQKQATLETQAIADKALRQLKQRADQVKFYDDLAKAEKDYQDQLVSEDEKHYGFRLGIQDDFVRSWVEKEGKLLQRAQVEGDQGAIDRLMAIYSARKARAQFKPDDASGYTAGRANADMVGSSPELFKGTQKAIEASMEKYKGYYLKIDELRANDNISENEAAQMRLQVNSEYLQTLQDLYVKAAQDRLDLGTGGWEDMMLASLSKVTDGFTTFSAGMTDLMGNFFDTFTDGFANSIGRAVVYADDLNGALKSVADEALAGLISGLVKLGVQWLINAAIGQSIQATSMATTMATTSAMATSAAAMWAPAAALASLASFGGNSAPAMAGMAATQTLAQSMAAMAGFAGAFDKGGTIPGGKWGIVGEFGPEIVKGPANVTSREKTAELLRSSRQEKSAPAAAPVVNLKNINVLDPTIVGDYLSSPAGEKVLMNTIQKNKKALA